MRELPATLPDGWTVKRLSTLAKVTSGGTPSRTKPEYWGGDVPWITTGEIDFNTITETDEHITQLGVANSSAKIFPKGTLLMAMFGQGVTRGKVAMLGVDATFNQACVAIVPRDGVSSRYLFHYLAARYDYIRSLANTGSQANLNGALIRGLDVIVPTPNDAKVITRVADTYDRSTDRLVRALKARRRLKRGLMQQLLTGQRRFPEYRRTPWREVAIGSVLQEINEPVELQPETKYRLVSIRRRSGGFFDRAVLPGANIGYPSLERLATGDFVIARRQVLHGAMAIVPIEFDGAYVSNAYAILRPRDPSELHLPFFNFLSQQQSLYHMAFRCSYGVAIEKMFFRLDWFFKERLRIPSAIEEQKKIVSVFETADAEIDRLQRLLHALKEQKKGLMQRLLTGKVRVPGSMLTEAAHA